MGAFGTNGGAAGRSSFGRLAACILDEGFLSADFNNRTRLSRSLVSLAFSLPLLSKNLRVLSILQNDFFAAPPMLAVAENPS